MSTQEKVAQMRIFHANQGVEQAPDGSLALSENVVARLTHGIAGIKNPGEHLPPVEAARLNNELQRYVIAHNRWGIPALFVTESYNGVDAAGCTRFGRPITSAASFDTALTHRQWDVVGREARLRGMHMCHSPEADIVRDPRFGRMSEAFGEDTYLTTEMVVAAVTGVQGDYAGLGAGTHIGAVVKHFAGYGQVLGGTNFAAIEISPRTLADEIFPPFEAAVRRARTLGVMASHGDLNGVASHANPWLLTEVLREEWGFEGYTVSDANDIARLSFFMHVAEGPEDAALQGLRAGMDVDLYSDEAYALLPALADSLPDILPLIDRSAGRVLRAKFTLGLFDDPYVDTAATAAGVRTAGALALAREADLASVILLKNDTLAAGTRPTLPLARDTRQHIALLGPLVGDSTAAQFGRIAGPTVDLVAAGGFTLTDGAPDIPQLSAASDATLDSLVALAGTADVTLLYLGGDEHTAKEGYFNSALGDRASIDPVGRQDELLRRVRALGRPVVVILKHRRTLSINEIAAEADAILDCWDLSEFGDEAVAHLVFGDASPAGKLPVTVPRTIGQLPFHYSGKGINAKKGYLFLEDGPLYPFGFGLGYGRFTYSPVRLSAKQVAAADTLTVAVTVTNTGTRAATETVQLYVSDTVGSVTRPVQELRGFARVALAPGEAREVRFAIPAASLAFTRQDMTRGLEAGGYRLRVGGSSVGGVEGVFGLVAE